MRRADINQTNSRRHNSRQNNLNQPNIELHIEHLILDGLLLSRNQGFDVQQALEIELTRLLETNGIGALADTSTTHARRAVGMDPIQPRDTTSHIGIHIAQTVHQHLSQATDTPQSTR
jgi:hypothetical protein